MSAATIRLWDPLIRIVHWWLVTVFIANYFLNEEGDDWHQWLGYSAVAAILLRLVWGFLGSRAARWRDFFPTPARLRHHVTALRHGENYTRLGHTPLGAVVMILMLLCMLGLGTTGYMMEEVDYFWGVSWVEQVHGLIANGLLALVLLHISAALYESYKLKENLPLSMITGRRRKP